MIQSVSAIEKEYLIKTVAQNEQLVRFHGISTIGTGLITEIDRTTLGVNLIGTFDNIPFSICEHLTGYFNCHGKTYAFETTVRNSKNNELRIDPPVRLLKSLQRKYVRVKKPRDIEVLFHLSNEDIVLDYPVCPEYVSVELGAQYQSSKDMQIPELVNAFRNELSSRGIDSNIVMFRTRKPERFEEELVSKTGKILYIPSTESGLPGKDPYQEGRIITRSIEEQFEDPNYFVEGSRFDRLLLEKKTEGIGSEIWCPILYYQYVVGYIYVRNSGTDSFEISMVDYLWDFSRILAYRLKETGYFSGGQGKTEYRKHKACILDISPGGMLISIPKKEINTPIRENSLFSVDIHPGNGHIACSARVARRYDDKDSVSYGTIFTNLSSNDLMTLYEFLYRRPYTNNDPLAYEQQI